MLKVFPYIVGKPPPVNSASPRVQSLTPKPRWQTSAGTPKPPGRGPRLGAAFVQIPAFCC